MSPENAEQEARCRQALDKLSKEFLHDPDINLIDIGFNTEKGHFTEEVVLRIHIRKRKSTMESRRFPKQVDDIPVIVMYGDYKPEANQDSK